MFAALIRTTGARDAQLLEALQSVSLQSLPCVAIVIVHGSEESYSRVKGLAEHVIHASEPGRRRGYPLNAGIEYCLTHVPEVRFLFFLDDDDCVYPFFTRAMNDAFCESDADVVYAGANRLESGKPLAQAYPLRPYYRLCDQNFMPSNSYSIRADALRHTGVRMDETMDSLEDWLFLLQLLERGCRFQQLDLTLSEFRTESEADFAYRNNLEQWKANARRVREYVNSTLFAIPGSDLARLPEATVAGAGKDRFSASTVNAALHRRVWELEHSFSWKLTAPVRAAAGVVLRLRSHWKART